MSQTVPGDVPGFNFLPVYDHIALSSKILLFPFLSNVLGTFKCTQKFVYLLVCLLVRLNPSH